MVKWGVVECISMSHEEQHLSVAAVAGGKEPSFKDIKVSRG